MLVFSWLKRTPSTASRLYDLEMSNGLMEDKLHALEVSYALLLQDVVTLKEHVAALEARPVMLPNPWDMAGQFSRVEPLPDVPTLLSSIKMARQAQKKEARS